MTTININNKDLVAAPDRRQRGEVRRLILIGSMLAEAVRNQDSFPDQAAALADLWETQLNIARPFLAGKTEGRS